MDGAEISSEASDEKIEYKGCWSRCSLGSLLLLLLLLSETPTPTLTKMCSSSRRFSKLSLAALLLPCLVTTLVRALRSLYIAVLSQSF
jgi:hypothetical protein